MDHCGHHAMFCIVVVFNNVVARLRCQAGSLEEASMEVGANEATNFRLVAFPGPAVGAAGR